jgi:hypothetical protein
MNPVTRRSLSLAAAILISVPGRAGGIDRQDLVRRHNPALTAIDAQAPLSVGNGGFAFTVDVTGLQSLQETYFKGGVPLETLARWAWHSDPNPRGYALSDATRPITAGGETVGYPTDDQSPAGIWLRRNPHDFPLAQIAWADGRGEPLKPGEITDVRQTLDMWTGEIRSEFRWHGRRVEVSTVADPDRDAIAVRATSPLIASGELRVWIAFPRGHDPETKNTPALDWTHPESHRTVESASTPQSAEIDRFRDDLAYHVGLGWSPGATLVASGGPHSFYIEGAAGADALEFTADFSAALHLFPLATWAQTRKASERHWRHFWSEGAAVDFSGSSDPRARELERRVVLSQYLTAIQCVGSVPPAETGLTCSSWYGKHNSEMAWWHAADFALWGHPQYVVPVLEWFKGTLPEARRTARDRMLPGARWSKMVGPDGRESPGNNPLIVWNQPHPIYLAELLYRADPGPAVLEKWRDVVFETADCMAGMLRMNPATGRFDLGPPLWIAQEIHDPKTSRNPTYELSYWSFALGIAQQWRVRLGMGRSPLWDECISKRAALPVRNGLYVADESDPDTWTSIASRHDHPSFLMALGVLPGADVDRATMGRTLDAVLSWWDWKTKIWGWDYPMIAMTATRLGEPEKAVGILLSEGPNNHYSASGHCAQGSDLATYLPANGSLLTAVSLMVAGWDGGPDQPGIPKDGTWKVRAEGLGRLP